jgi:hypothetical protein
VDLREKLRDLLTVMVADERSVWVIVAVTVTCIQKLLT